MPKELSFEKSLEKLSQAVDALEDTELALDKALKIFSEGVKHAKVCETQLQKAEAKLEMVIADSDEWKTQQLDTQIGEE